MCYACICGPDDFKPPEKCKGKGLVDEMELCLSNCCVNCDHHKPFHLFIYFQLMQADPHKLDFRSDPLARFPGAVGLGQLGTLPPTHDLTRPPTLFPAGGAYRNILLQIKDSMSVKSRFWIFVDSLQRRRFGFVIDSYFFVH